MSIRRDPLFISYEVWRSLRLLAKAKNPPPDSAGRIMTADELADTLLRETIAQRYPQLTAHLHQIDKLEKETIQSLK